VLRRVRWPELRRFFVAAPPTKDEDDHREQDEQGEGAAGDHPYRQPTGGGRTLEVAG
jgi:hypothetical protein